MPSDGYDLIIEATRPISDVLSFSVTKGSILECEQKVANNEPINAILIIHEEWSTIPEEARSNKIEMVYNLTYWHCPYRTLHFGATIARNSSTGVQVYTFEYNAITGALVNFSNPYNLIS